MVDETATTEITTDCIRQIFREELAGMDFVTREEVDSRFEKERHKTETLVEETARGLRGELTGLASAIQQTLAKIENQVAGISGQLSNWQAALAARDDQVNKNAADIEAAQKTLQLVSSNQAAGQMALNTLQAAIFGDKTRAAGPESLWAVLRSLETRVTALQTDIHGQVQKNRQILNLVYQDFYRRKMRQKRTRDVLVGVLGSRWLKVIAILGSGSIAGLEIFDLFLGG